MNLIPAIKALNLLLLNTKIFRHQKIFRNKRVAVIGAADSAFKEEQGEYINGFDYVIRQNKAILSLTPEKMRYVGNRTDVHFHSFFENEQSGGGRIDQELFREQGVKFLVNPISNLEGFRTHYAYFKRNLNKNKTYFLSPLLYQKMTRNFGKWVPTVGFSSLYTVLNSGCEEVYITGFTFFKTPYADNYRDHVKDTVKNDKFMMEQGRHNPDLELKEFIAQLEKAKKSGTKVRLDTALASIVKNIINERESKNF